MLKRDVFSTIERGRFRTDSGEVDAVLRRLDEVPWWSRLLAYALFRRERRALAIAGPLGIAPPLLFAGGASWCAAGSTACRCISPSRTAMPPISAPPRRPCATLHRAGIAHNDLAKEQNWLYADGRAYLTDFQLAACFRRRSRLFRLARYEDLRHLLKHKRRYAPDALTAAERRVLARKSFITRAWMATGKKIYYADHPRPQCHRSRGPRHALRPRRAGDRRRLRTHPQVRDVAVVAFPDRRAGTGLYAFVEGNANDRELLDFLGTPRPEHLQVVDALPRDAQGEVRSEILELVAMNQLDLIAPLIKTDAERAIVGRIVSEPAQSARPLRILSTGCYAGDPRRISRRAPDQPLPPPWRHFGGREGIAAIQTIERRPHQRDGKKCRQRLARQRHHALHAPRRDGGARGCAIRQAPR